MWIFHDLKLLVWSRELQRTSIFKSSVFSFRPLPFTSAGAMGVPRGTCLSRGESCGLGLGISSDPCLDPFNLLMGTTFLKEVVMVVPLPESPSASTSSFSVTFPLSRSRAVLFEKDMPRSPVLSSISPKGAGLVMEVSCSYISIAALFVKLLPGFDREAWEDVLEASLSSGIVARRRGSGET